MEYGNRNEEGDGEQCDCKMKSGCGCGCEGRAYEPGQRVTGRQVSIPSGPEEDGNER